MALEGCNLSGNGGLGVQNGGTPDVDARGDWWGDPAGPGGPAGYGASANVDSSNPLASPAVLGY